MSITRTPNWLRHTLRRAPWHGQQQVVLMAVLAALVAAVIGALYLAQVAAVSTSGRQLAALVITRDNLEQTNEQLRVQIAEARSIPILIARARALGFDYASSDEITYLVVEGWNPNRARTVAPLVEEAPVLPSYDETFDGWLRLQWDGLVRQFDQFMQGGRASS